MGHVLEPMGVRRTHTSRLSPGEGPEQMEIEKDQVVDLLRSRGEHDRAQQVDCALPRHVDTDRDAGLLHTFEINVCDLPEDGDVEAPEA